MSAEEHEEQPGLEEQVRLLKAQLAHSQKLAALGELAGTTTHEFNNVLMTIINYAKLGLRHKDQATREKSFEKILAAGNRAARLTTSVLGLARNRADTQEPSDLQQLVEETLTLLERELAKYHVVVEKYYRPAPAAVINPNQIQQVLLNLLINARQAMPHGGRVIIKIGPDDEAGFVQLVVRDNGCGIPPEFLRRIFNPFFTTKKGPDATGRGGTGLGLSMCRDVIEAHHGRIRVESSVGKGTAFTLKLPAVAAPAVAAPADTLAAGALPPPGPHAPGASAG